MPIKSLFRKKTKAVFNIDQYIFPIIPSPIDDRDYQVENLLAQYRPKTLTANYPETLDLRKYLNVPRNQGARGTCAAFTASTIKEYHERRDVAYRGYMSPNSIYFYRENQDTSGMYGRDVMKILNKMGAAPEPYFPYTDYEPTEVPEKAQEIMKNFIIKEYARVTTIEGAKEALYRYGPLMICVPVYHNSPEIWKPKDANDTVRGGHAMTIVGYDANGFIVRNSWGNKWNGDGYVIFPYADFGMQWEIWSTVDEASPPLPDQLKGNYYLLKLLLLCNKDKGHAVP